MKQKLIYGITAPVLLLFAAGSESTPHTRLISVDEKQKDSTLKLSLGDQVEVSLPGNPTTGYQWVLSAVKPDILEQLGELEYKTSAPALGSGGRFTLRLKAISPGESPVELDYRRPFDALDVPSSDKFRILVQVTQ
jgi:inhibitor of cysteine peptidase